MIKLLIMCGTGIATSTIVTEKVKVFLSDQKLEEKVVLYQSKVSDEIGRIDDYDIVLTSTIVPDKIREKVIDVIPLLTGFGTEKVFENVLKKIKQLT